MHKDGSGRSLLDILFSRQREVDGFPWLRGEEEITVPAKRNGGRGGLSAMLAKSVAVVLKGGIVGITTLVEGGALVRRIA
jgi:hypothetical protein